MADSSAPSIQLSTAGSHSLHAVTMEWLRISLQDMNGAPLKGCKYKLTVKEPEGEREISASATEHGLLEQEIRVGTVEGTLEIWLESDLKATYALKIGPLPAADTADGFKTRLNNLGFDCGGTQGDPDATSLATKGFQRKHKLKVTGTNDEDTRARLLQLYGG